MKILAFAGSNSDTSINRKVATYVSTFFENNDIEILDLNDYEMPIYKAQREEHNGIPKLAYDFAQKIDEADLIILSLAEHNGNYSAAFKNLYDWVSRIPSRKVFADTPLFLMATSGGKRGGASVLEIAKNRFPFDGAKILETFSLPYYYEYFEEGKGIINEEKNTEFQEKLRACLNFIQ